MKTTKPRNIKPAPAAAPVQAAPAVAPPHTKITHVATTRDAQESFVRDLVTAAQDAVKVINASLGSIHEGTFRGYGVKEMVSAALRSTMQELGDAAFCVEASAGKAAAA